MGEVEEEDGQQQQRVFYFGDQSYISQLADSAERVPSEKPKREEGFIVGSRCTRPQRL